MSTERLQVSTADELQAAAANRDIRQIVVSAPIANVPPLRLSPGQNLIGTEPQSALHFLAGRDGLELYADNHVERLQLVTPPDKRPLFNDTGVEHLGRLLLRDLTVKGVVQLLARDRVRSGHVEANNIDI